MHVGFDLAWLSPGGTGGREVHAREVLAELRRIAPALRVTTFLNAETAEAGPGWWSAEADRAVVVRRTTTRSLPRWAAGELVLVPAAAARAGVDVYHGPANFGAPAGPYARVLTLHDLLWRRRPDLVPQPRRTGTDLMIRAAARAAHRLVTVSQATSDEIAAEGLAPADRVVVALNGARPPVAGDAARGRALLGGERRRPVALAIATDVPHKNLDGLLRAVAALDPGERPLVAVAGHGTDAGRLPGLVRELGIGGDVRLLGAVAQDALEDLFAAADVHVHPTFFEGFGMTLVEAMLRGVPVVCSDLAVLREVGGDAVVLVDPAEPADIARGIRTALVPQAADRLRRRGRDRAQRFTWEQTARGTLRAYEEALEARARPTSARVA